MKKTYGRITCQPKEKYNLIYPLKICYIAIENGSFSLLIYLLTMVIFYSYVYVYQRVTPNFSGEPRWNRLVDHFQLIFPARNVVWVHVKNPEPFRFRSIQV